VINARVKYWAGDAYGYTDALGVLLRRCRRRARNARLDADRQMWIERGARVGLIAASQFIETKVSFVFFFSNTVPLFTNSFIY
jgi:trafficking protein particle complex subunit 12